jgi:hypothetical protein
MKFRAEDLSQETFHSFGFFIDPRNGFEEKHIFFLSDRIFYTT